MPILPNPRHERFAQALAAGKTADEAYQEAGYSANRGNATRLKANESVERRVAELQGRAAERTEITVEYLTRLHLLDHASARLVHQYAAATGALTQIAKLNGLIIERSETKVHVEDLLERLGTPSGGAEAPGRPDPVRGDVPQDQNQDGRDPAATLQ